MISDNTISVRLSADAQELQRALSQGTGYIEGFSGRAVGSMREVGAETGKLEGGFASLAQGIKSAFVGSSIAVGLIGLKNMISDVTQELVQTQIQADKMRNGLNFAVGAENAAGEMAFLRQSAQSLGLELVSTSLMYTKLAAASRGTTLAGQQTREVFTSIAQASTVMGLSAEQTEGALLAITQMISKGKVQAEELRGQLGERLPGAFQIASRAMGVTTAELDKMLVSGQVLATDFLPKFAKQLTMETAPALDEASKSMQASVNRMSNAWTDLKRNVNESGVGKAIQQEIMGMGNYVQAASDAMENSRVNGGNSLAQLSASFGQMIARAPFDALSLASNGLNGSLNLLSGGALKLNTDLNLLPDSLNTNEQRIKALTAELPKAEKELIRLRAQLEKQPGDPYLKFEIQQLFLFVEKAREAKAASDRLKNITTEDATKAGITASGMAREAYEKDRAASMAELLAMKNKLAGVDKDYLPTLEKLQGWRERGIVAEKEYIALVSDLASANYKADKTAKAPKDRTNAFRAEQDAAKSWADALKDAQRISDKATASTNNLNEAQARLVQYLESPAFATNSAEMREVAVSALVAASGVIELADQKKALAKSQDELSKANAKYYDGLTKDLAAQEETNQKLRESNEEIGLTTEALGALQLARMDAVIAQEQEIMSMASMAEASALDLLMMQKRIDKLKEERLLTSTSATKRAAYEAVQANTKAWEKGWEETDRLGRETFTSWATEGGNAAEKIGKSLETALFSAMYEATLRPLAFQIYNSVAGGSPAGSAMSGLGSLGNMASAAGSMAGIGSAFTGAFSAGAAVGTEAFGAGMTMMAEASGMSSFMAGAGQALGAMGPVGWAALAAVAVLALSSGPTSTRSTGYGVREYGADGALLSSGTDGGGIGEAAVALDALNASYRQISKSLGATGGAKFTYNSNTGRESEDPQFYIKSGSYDSGEIQKNADNVALATSRAIFAALQDSTLPKFLEGAFDGMVAGSLSAEQLNAVLTGAQALKGFNDQLLALPFANLADLSFAATQQLIGFGGGLDGLKTNLAAYYTNFYSQEEQRAQTIKNINAATAGSGLDAATATVESFRALVDAAMLDTSETGLKTTASLLAVAGALAGVIPKAEDTSKALEDAAKAAADAATELAKTNQGWVDQLAVLTGAETERGIALRDAGDDTTRALMRQVYAQQDLNDAADATSDALTKAAESAKAAVDLAIQTAAASKSALQTVAGQYQAFASATASARSAANSASAGITSGYLSAVDAVAAAQADIANATQQAGQNLLKLADGIRQFINGLDQSAAGGLGQRGQYAASQSDFTIALAQARAGDQDAMGRITGLASSMLALGQEQSASTVDYRRLVSVTKGQLDGLATGTESANAAAKAVDPVVAAQEKLLKAQADLAKWTEAVSESGASTERQITDYASDWRKANQAYLKALGDQNIADQLTMGLDLTLGTPLQILADAVNALGLAMVAQRAALAATGAAPIPSVVAAASSPAPTEQRTNVGGTDVWSSTGGALGVYKPDNSLDIYGKNGVDQYSSQEAIAFVNSKVSSGNATDVYKKALETGISANSLDALMGWTPGTSNNWAMLEGLPKFDVGTNYVPRDMFAEIHEGEAIIPKAYNPAAGGSTGAGNTARLETLVEGLTAEVKRLQGIVQDGNVNTKQLADQFDEVSEGGNALRQVAI